jgi:hypothetical protein
VGEVQEAKTKMRIGNRPSPTFDRSPSDRSTPASVDRNSCHQYPTRLPRYRHRSDGRGRVFASPNFVSAIASCLARSKRPTPATASTVPITRHPPQGEMLPRGRCESRRTSDQDEPASPPARRQLKRLQEKMPSTPRETKVSGTVVFHEQVQRQKQSLPINAVSPFDPYQSCLFSIVTWMPSRRS